MQDERTTETVGKALSGSHFGCELLGLHNGPPLTELGGSHGSYAIGGVRNEVLLSQGVGTRLTTCRGCTT